MTQQTSPFLEASYGWPFGSSGWNVEMDQNLVKFSYLFDRNIDAIVGTLPAIVNGKAYFLTADNRLYFDAGGQRYSSPTPKWFMVTDRDTGQVYQFNGTSLIPVDDLATIDSRLDAVELTLTYRLKSPMDFGAVGDGVANDTSAWLAAEADVGTTGTIYLPPGKSFAVIAGTKPATNVVGEGSLIIGGVVFDKLSMNYDLFRTSLYFNPPSYTDEIGFPGGNGNLTLMISPGAKRLGNTNRCTFLGTQGPRQTINLDRCEGLGNGTLMFTKYAERTTAVGTIAFQYLGCTDPAADNHGWWSDAGGFTPGQPGWDYGGLETRNPGIGAQIAAFTGYATQATDVGRSVAVGRDAFNGTPVATGSVAVGYRACAGAFAVSNITALGSDAFRDGVFITNSVAAGTFAGNHWQQGDRNALFGYNAAANGVRGSNNTLLGNFSGYDYTDLNGCIFIGNGSGNGLGGTAQTNVLAIGPTSANPLISGNLTGFNAGINIAPSAIKGTLHVRTNDFGAAVSANAAADDLIVENSSGAGMTIRSGATGGCNLLFANPTIQNVGGVLYSNSTDTMTFRANSGDRWQIDNAAFNPAVDNALSVGKPALRPSVIYAGTGTINTSDETMKVFTNDITDTLLDAWREVDWRSWKFTDAVESKGSEARVHFGVGAQSVQREFEAKGLDAFKYGLLCYDAWEETPELVDDAGNILQQHIPAGERYGIRYEEALALESALMRRTTQRLEARIATLELASKLNN